MDVFSIIKTGRNNTMAERSSKVKASKTTLTFYHLLFMYVTLGICQFPSFLSLSLVHKRTYFFLQKIGI